ncbi:MAG: hypothetical protein E7559_10345 [Ruminococcaceae bacterium]|nr:hypothetical protein [Oscillospiraceae bacterium]
MSIKALIAAVLMLLTVSGSALSDVPLTEYRVRELEMTINLPAEAYATGRKVDPAFPLLETYGMTAEQLEKNYKDRDIYYNAVWYDNDAEVTEIVVTMTENHDTRSMYDLNIAEQHQIDWIEELYLNYDSESQSGARYYDVSNVNCGGANFFRAKGTVDAEKRRNVLEYMTIVNGRKIEVTMIEYLSESDGEEQRMTVSPEHELLMDTVMQSVEFDEIKSVFMARYGGLVRASVFTGILAIAMLVTFAVNKFLTQKAKQPDEQSDILPEPEEEAVECSPEEENNETPPLSDKLTEEEAPAKEQAAAEQAEEEAAEEQGTEEKTTEENKE